MKKIGIALGALGLVAVTLFLISPKEEEVFTTVEHLPIVEVALPGEEGASWVFQALVCGQTRIVDVYPGVVHALMADDHRVAMNLTDCPNCDERYGDKRRSFEYIGETEEGIHVLLSDDLQKEYASHLLFVEIIKSQGATLRGKLGPYRREQEDGKFVFYDDQVLIKKIGKITLPGLWLKKKEEDSAWVSRRVELKGNILKLDSLEFVLCLAPPSPPRLVKKEGPYHWDARPYINPYVAEEFISCIRTGGSVNIAYDLIRAQNNPKYSNYLGTGLTPNPLGHVSYTYEGMLTNGVHIIRTLYIDTRPPTSRYLMFIFEEDYELNVDWDAQMITRDKKSILIKKVGELDLYLSGPFVLEENTISYTEMYWDNKPSRILDHPVECEEFIYEIEL